jgi:hypothetical protein
MHSRQVSVAPLCLGRLPQVINLEPIGRLRQAKKVGLSFRLIDEVVRMHQVQGSFVFYGEPK